MPLMDDMRQDAIEADAEQRELPDGYERCSCRDCGAAELEHKMVECRVCGNEVCPACVAELPDVCIECHMEASK